MTADLDPVATTHTCPACRVLDLADGVDDGRLVPQLRAHTQNATTLLSSLQRVQDRAADAVTAFAGSLNFVYLHSVWFGIWVLLNVGLVGAGVEFDRYPFGLLTMIVSLEAIFLSTFVMVSQNRQAARDNVRANLDFENNIRSEIWSIHVGQALGLDVDHVEDIVKRAIEGAAEAMRQAQAMPGG